MLAALERRIKSIQAEAARWSLDGPGGGAADDRPAPVFALGQRVVHKLFGYRGVVVGWDNMCCESKEWIAASGADRLAGGLAQPFYHLLVDGRDWQWDPTDPPVAYAAQEMLTAPSVEDGASWVEVRAGGGGGGAGRLGEQLCGERGPAAGRSQAALDAHAT
jgi:hemimethylated DNA binding protein